MVARIIRDQFRARASALNVTRAPDLQTPNGCATVLHFEGDQYGNYEAVAYIDEKQAVIMLVTSDVRTGN